MQQDSHRFTFIYEHPDVFLRGGEQEGLLEQLHGLLCLALLGIGKRREHQHLNLAAGAPLPSGMLVPAFQHL